MSEQTHEEGTLEATEIITGDLSELFLGGTENWGPKVLTYFGESNRTILIAGDIEEVLANCIVSQLLELDSQSNETITVYINTEGGDVHQALAIFDTMRTIKSPIVTLAVGTCMSAGLLLLQGGDIRSTMPRTRFMYHEPLAGGSVFNSESAAAFAENYEWAKSQAQQIIMERGSITPRQWADEFHGRTAMFLTAQEALDFGLLDTILEYRKEKANG